MERRELVLRLREQLFRVDPTLPADLPDDGPFQAFDLDSLDLVEFVARLEQDFSIMIADTDLLCFSSLQASAQYIEMRLA
jgi:acyl carrier protein